MHNIFMNKSGKFMRAIAKWNISQKSDFAAVVLHSPFSILHCNWRKLTHILCQSLSTPNIVVHKFDCILISVRFAQVLIFYPHSHSKTPLHPKSEAIYGAPKMISALLSASKIVKGGFLGMGTCTG